MDYCEPRREWYKETLSRLARAGWKFGFYSKQHGGCYRFGVRRCHLLVPRVLSIRTEAEIARQDPGQLGNYRSLIFKEDLNPAKE